MPICGQFQVVSDSSLQTHDFPPYHGAAASDSEALRQAQKEWEQTFDSVPDLIAILDDRQRIVRVNRAMAQRLGLTPEACVGHFCYQAVHGTNGPPGYCPHAAAMSDGQTHTVDVHEPRLGSDFLVTTVPRHDADGRVIGTVHVARDITKRKRAEDALRHAHQETEQHRAQLEAVFHTMADGVMVFDVAGNVVLVNEAEARICGYASSTEMRRDLAYFVDVFELADLDGRLVPVEQWPVSRVLRGESLADWELRGRRRDTGQEWFFSFSGQPVRDELGRQTLAVIVTRDITQRKLAEAALSDSDERLRLAQSHGDVGIWAWNPQTGEVTFEPELEQLYGLPPGTIRTYQDWAQRVHAEDLARVEAERDAALARGEPFHVEFRIRHTSGELRWIAAKGKATYNEAGAMVRVLGVNIDITAQKQAKAALEGERNLLRTLIDLLPDLIYVRDAEDRFVVANATLAGKLDASPDEMLGKTDADFFSPEMTAAYCADDQRVLGGASVVNREEPVAFPNGQRGVLLTTKVPLRDNHGDVVGLVGIGRDITARKRADREREITMELLRLVNACRGTRELVHAAVTFFQQQTGCDAVGVRLRDGDDYPYYETRGFPPEFVRLENQLCVRDLAGQIVRDEVGNPLIECMCGNVICGRFDPAKPFFTPHGSFWTNGTTELLASTTEADRQARTRNRCNGLGYESVALFPLRVGEERLGLLQLNDRRPGMFSAETIDLWERLAGYLAVGLAKARADEALRASEEKYRQYVESSPAAVFVLDDQGRFLEANEAAGRLTGYPVEELRSLSISELTPPAERHGVEANYGQLQQAGCCSGDQPVVKKDGTLIDVTVNAVRIAPGRYLAYCLDVTDRKRAQLELAQARDAAEAANRAKSAFLANMSHEIRTPMTAILGFADLLQAPDTSTEEQREYTETIQRNAKLLLQLINDILDLSKVEAGKLSLEAIPCSPRQIVDEIAAMLSERASRKRIGLHVDCPPSVPALIRTDPTRLRQILVNLIGNAIKFTDCGQVRVGLRPCRNDGRWQLEFSVSDPGIGIPAEAIPRLFQPFTQADASLTRRFGGSGLGLALSRRLATALGGDITVSSREGQGSTFTLSINIDPPATEAVASVRKAEDQRRVQGSGTDAPQRMVRRVLLVEDDRDVQRLVLHLLQKLEIEADLAENGEIACQRARHALSAGRPYELILMDVEMPVMNGLDATRRLRREGWTGPIIALTAHAMSGDREMCRAASCDDYVPKPISRDALQAVLLRHLRLASTAAALATAYREARKPDESVDAGLAVAN